MKSNEAKGLPNIYQVLKEGGKNSRYEVERRGGEPHGKGALYLDDVKIESTWVDGKISDECKIVFPDGFEFEGTYPEGNGVIRIKDGVTYKGSIRLLMKHGKGTIIYPDGSKFEGNWVNDFIEGQGVLSNEDGMKIRLIHKNGYLLSATCL
jgi:hypothetical protein